MTKVLHWDLFSDDGEQNLTSFKRLKKAQHHSDLSPATFSTSTFLGQGYCHQDRCIFPQEKEMIHNPYCLDQRIKFYDDEFVAYYQDVRHTFRSSWVRSISPRIL